MTIIYIRAIVKSNLFCRLFNKFTIKDIENKKMIYLPLNEKSSARKTEKVIKKLCKYLYKNNITTCTIDNQLMRNPVAKNVLYSHNINILEGHKLNKFLLYNLLEKVYSLKNKKIETGEVTLLINENDELNIENIIRIAENIKRLNIITNNMKQFNRIVDNLYDELGILIRLTNNMKTNLNKSDIIVNVDFPEQLINKLNIPKDAIILNIPNNININLKKFSGINIKSWKIEIPEKYKLESFLDISMYEAQIYSKPTNQVFKQIQDDKIKIKDFIGLNGIINPNEFYHKI